MYKSINFEKTTISKKVVEHIKSLIIHGQLKEGDKLPSEREMSEILKVSRNTVREAYKILSTLGFVQIRHGQGVYVSSNKETINHWAASFFMKKDQLFELFEIRKLLETQSIKWAVKRITEGQLQELKELVQEDVDFINNNREKYDISQTDQRFHLLIAKISGNSVLYRIMNNLIDLLNDVRKETILIPGRMEKSVQEHQRILDALAKRDMVKAEQEMKNHLDSVEGALFPEGYKDSIED